jgi:hypothetical protein
VFWGFEVFLELVFAIDNFRENYSMCFSPGGLRPSVFVQERMNCTFPEPTEVCRS